MCNKKKRVSKRDLKSYAPIVGLIGENSQKNKTNLNKSLLAILPPEGLEVVCECLHNAIHSKYLDSKSRKKLANVQNRKAIRQLATAGGGQKYRKKRGIALKHSEDVGKTLDAVYPLLANAVRKK